jgi:hypothetical protein
MDQNRANARDFGGLDRAKNSIPEERRADSTALKSGCDGEPSDDDNGSTQTYGSRDSRSGRQNVLALCSRLV